MFDSGDDDVDGVDVPSVWDLWERGPQEVPSSAEFLADVRGGEPGPTQLDGLSRIDVQELSADDAVTALQEMQRCAAYVAGVEAQLRAQVTQRVVAHLEAQFAADAERGRQVNEARVAAGLPPVGIAPRYVFPEQVAYSEITAALRLSPVTGESRILLAQELMGAWRPLSEAMLAGQITSDHTAAIARRLRYLPGHGSSDPVEVAAYERNCASILAKVVPYAVTHTPGEAGKKTRLLVSAVDPAGARARRRKTARDTHGVTVTALEPGTSEFRAVGPTAHIEAMHQAVKTLARDARFEVSDECVTRGQRQVAALSTLVLGDPGSVGTVTGPVSEAKLGINLTVLVPVDTIVGASEQGGRIGTTPATADEIRDLLTHACDRSSTIRRLVTTPPAASWTPDVGPASRPTCRSTSSRYETRPAATPAAPDRPTSATSTTHSPGKPAVRRTSRTSDRCAEATTHPRPKTTGPSPNPVGTVPVRGDHHSAASTITNHRDSSRPHQRR